MALVLAHPFRRTWGCFGLQHVSVDMWQFSLGTSKIWRREDKKRFFNSFNVPLAVMSRELLWQALLDFQCISCRPDSKNVLSPWVSEIPLEFAEVSILRLFSQSTWVLAQFNCVWTNTDWTRKLLQISPEHFFWQCSKETSFLEVDISSIFPRPENNVDKCPESQCLNTASSPNLRISSPQHHSPFFLIPTHCTSLLYIRIKLCCFLWYSAVDGQPRILFRSWSRTDSSGWPLPLPGIPTGITGSKVVRIVPSLRNWSLTKGNKLQGASSVVFVFTVCGQNHLGCWSARGLEEGGVKMCASVSVCITVPLPFVSDKLRMFDWLVGFLCSEVDVR